MIFKKYGKKSLNNADNKISASIKKNIAFLEEKLSDCPDVIRRKVTLKNGKQGYFIYVDGLIDTDLIQRDFIKPIVSIDYESLKDKEDDLPIPVASIKYIYTNSDMLKEIFKGNIIFIGDGVNHAISGGLDDKIKRPTVEPETEKNIRGPHEGFIESINVNMSILRKKIKNANLKFKTFTVGETTNQMSAVAYIEGIADPELFKVISEKIESINVDGLMAIGHMEQLITDHPNSPFPQYQGTERPDKVVAALLDGKYAIILDGTPFVLMVPVDFFSFFQTLDDYSMHWMVGSFLRFLRMLAIFVSVFLPGLYIAVLTFHYYSVPLQLLIPLAESRAKVPFPPVIEALILEVVIEMLREAAVRLPTYIGASIGVVGGLILGQAAVEAGIASTIMIIVVSITAIATFVIPNYDMGSALRRMRFAVMACSAFFGFVGIIVAGAFLGVHLVALESIGQPYLKPLSPFYFKNMKDTLIRLPIKLMRKRPDTADAIDQTRGKKKYD